MKDKELQLDDIEDSHTLGPVEWGKVVSRGVGRNSKTLGNGLNDKTNYKHLKTTTRSTNEKSTNSMGEHTIQTRW